MYGNEAYNPENAIVKQLTIYQLKYTEVMYTGGELFWPAYSCHW